MRSAVGNDAAQGRETTLGCVGRSAWFGLSAPVRLAARRLSVSLLGKGGQDRVVRLSRQRSTLRLIKKGANMIISPQTTAVFGLAVAVISLLLIVVLVLRAFRPSTVPFDATRAIAAAEEGAARVERAVREELSIARGEA